VVENKHITLFSSGGRSCLWVTQSETPCHGGHVSWYFVLPGWFHIPCSHKTPDNEKS